MATLEFQVQDAGGVVSRRRVSTEDVPGAVEQLLQSGLNPLSYREVPVEKPRRRRIPEGQLTTFYRSLATSLNDGVPLVDSLSFIARESRSPVLQTVMADIARQVNDGVSLDRAMATWPTTFPEADLAIVRSGRQSGTLPTALTLLADHRQTTASMSRRVAMALVYPVVIATLIGLMLTVFMVFMFPRFMDLFEELGIGADKMPLLTLAVAWLGSHWIRLMLWFFVLVGVLTAIVRAYARSITGRLAWDYVKLRTPLLGTLVYHAALKRSCGLMGVLLSRRIPLVESLRLAAESAGNAVLGGAFRTAAERVSAGERLSVALRNAEVLPEGLPWRVAVAEQAGDMAASFREAEQTHEAEAELRLRAFTTILEPLLIIGLGLFVGCVIIGLLAPLIAVIQQLSGG